MSPTPRVVVLARDYRVASLLASMLRYRHIPVDPLVTGPQEVPGGPNDRVTLAVAHAGSSEHVPFLREALASLGDPPCLLLVDRNGGEALAKALASKTTTTVFLPTTPEELSARVRKMLEARRVRAREEPASKRAAR
jgi:DNA-binding response OmpR family regulator